MATAPITPAPAAPVSWLKKVGLFLGKILGIVATKVDAPVQIAAKFAELALPQFATTIAAGAGLIDNIAKEAIAAETMVAAGQAAVGGPAKLAAVVAASGPAIDNWVSSSFPGASGVSAAAKAGLVNSVVAILNEVAPSALIPAPATTTTPTPPAPATT